MIELKRLNYSYEESAILKNIDFQFEKGQFYGVIGPNGSGKTTLLKLIAKILKAPSHTILVLEQDITHIKEKQRAKTIAMVPQIFDIDLAFTVEDIVAMGRYPYIDKLGHLSEKDWQLVHEALRRTNLFDNRKREVSTLSGGELQRVILARAIAQQTKIMLLDEPLSHLDIHHQLDILELSKALCMTEEKTILCVMHDLNLTMKYCDQTILLSEGQIFAAGKTEDVLTQENIYQVYGINVSISQINGQSVITY